MTTFRRVHPRRVVIERGLIPDLGSTKLVDLSRTTVVNYARRLVDSGDRHGHGLSAKTAHVNIVGVLRTAMNAAVEQDLIERNLAPYPQGGMSCSAFGVRPRCAQSARSAVSWF